jgi:hypothetical protein
VPRWFAELISAIVPVIPARGRSEKRTHPEGAPSVVDVVLDDVGFGGRGTFGGLVEMPHITRLDANGLRETTTHGPFRRMQRGSR